MSIGPGEILIVFLILLMVLVPIGGLSLVVYFIVRKPRKRSCAVCGLPNVSVGAQCMRCGTVA